MNQKRPILGKESGTEHGGQIMHELVLLAAANLGIGYLIGRRFAKFYKSRFAQVDGSRLTFREAGPASASIQTRLRRVDSAEGNRFRRSSEWREIAELFHGQAEMQHKLIALNEELRLLADRQDRDLPREKSVSIASLFHELRRDHVAESFQDSSPGAG